MIESEKLKIQCLELAIQTGQQHLATDEDILKSAKLYWDFVSDNSGTSTKTEDSE
jgi:hypothetical protein